MHGSCGTITIRGMNLSLAILLFSALTTNGLFVLWAATSRRGWFLRAALYLAFLATLLLISAYEPLIALALQGGVIVVAVQLRRWLQRRRSAATRDDVPARRWRISLLSMLQITAILGVVSAVAARTPELNHFAWQSIIAIGLCSGASFALAYWAGGAPGWRRMAAIPAAILAAAAFGVVLGGVDWFVLSALGGDWVEDNPGLGIFILAGDRDATSFIAEWAWVLPCSVAAMCIVGGLRGSLYGAADAQRGRVRRGLLSASAAICAAIITAPAVGMLWALMNPDPIPVVDLPEPNGFADLQAALGVLEENFIVNTGNFDRDTATEQELVDAVNEVRSAIERAEVAVQSPGVREVDYSAGAELDFDSVQQGRSMARAMDAAGRLAEVQGNYTEALRWHLNCVRHGFALRRGGLIIDDLVGTACVGVGASGVYDVREHLSDQQRIAAIASIGELIASVEPFEAVEYRDRVWTQRAMGWMAHLSTLLNADDSSNYGRMRIVESAKCRLLMFELAIKAFDNAHGRLPGDLQELALSAEIAVDPFSPVGESFRYRVTDSGYQLYSVGQNGIDDHGAAPTSGLSAGLSDDGDLSLEAEFNPPP
jgi:hypothetical protein